MSGTPMKNSAKAEEDAGDGDQELPHGGGLRRFAEAPPIAIAAPW